MSTNGQVLQTFSCSPTRLDVGIVLPFAKAVLLKHGKNQLGFGEARTLLEEDYPDVEKIRWVCDNLNTYSLGAFYETFEPNHARLLARRLEIVPTPKHGSWLNIAENELSALTAQCVKGRRFGTIEELQEEAMAWAMNCNRKQKGVQWRFTQKTQESKSNLYILSFCINETLEATLMANPRPASTRFMKTCKAKCTGRASTTRSAARFTRRSPCCSAAMPPGSSCSARTWSRPWPGRAVSRCAESPLRWPNLAKLMTRRQRNWKKTCPRAGRRNRTSGRRAHALPDRIRN
jgi:hypothetical protein